MQAIGKETDAIRWELNRTNGQGNMDSPIAITVKGQPQVVVSGNRRLVALNPADELLYFVSAGSNVIVSAGPTHEVVAVDILGGGDGRCGSSAAVSNGRIDVCDVKDLDGIGKQVAE